jgi:NADH:ubiquinone oxidoreductase subunit K
MLLNQFLFLGAVLFCIGVYGVITRRNAVMVLMSIELILNAVQWTDTFLRCMSSR